MSLLNPDYSKDLEREQILGVLTNTYNLFHGSVGLGGGGIGKATTSYIPYNLIITNNFIFGEHLDLDTKTRSISTFSTDDGQLNSIEEYLTSGQLSMGAYKTSGKIEMKFDYNKTNGIKINKEGTTEGTLQKIADFRNTFKTTKGVPNTISIKLSSLFVTTTFIANVNLSDGLYKLLNETQFSKKVAME
jgi:hypothetical protein